MRPKKNVEPVAPSPAPSLFQVRGEDKQYEGIDAAIRRAREKGRGSEVIRVSDGALMATVSIWLPPKSRSED